MLSEASTLIAKELGEELVDDTNTIASVGAAVPAVVVMKFDLNGFHQARADFVVTQKLQPATLGCEFGSGVVVEKCTFRQLPVSSRLVLNSDLSCLAFAPIRL